MTFLDDLVIEPGAIYLMDRGYVDFARLHRFTDEAAFVVTRSATAGEPRALARRKHGRTDAGPTM